MARHTSETWRWWRARESEAEGSPRRRSSGPARSSRTLNYPTTVLGSVLGETAERYAETPAVIYGNLRWTYQELDGTARRLAAGLGQLGVDAGDSVVVTLPNCPELLSTFFAIQIRGATVVNAGPLMGPDDLRAILGRTRARLVVALDLQAPRVAPLLEEYPHVRWVWASLKGYQTVWRRLGYRLRLWQGGQVFSDGDGRQMLEELTDSEDATDRSDQHPDSIAVLQPTGGTTGRLKLARLSHRNLLANATQISTCTRLRPAQESIFAVLPMFHVYGLSTGVIAPVLFGGTILPLTRFRCEPMLATLEAHRPTVVPLVPAIAQALCDRMERRPRPDAAAVLRQALVLSGAAPLPRTTDERFRRVTGGRIIQGYGLTEASPVTHTNPVQAPREGSIGQPLPDTHAFLVGLHDRSRVVASGEPGELVVEGPQVGHGYFDDPEETAAVFDTDETGHRRLFTGDIAEVDDEGFFYLLDRKKDMINRDGMKIYPAKIEPVLKAHPKVSDAAVVGVPDPVHTEAAVAAIVPAERDAGKLGEALRTDCQEHLAPYEVPSRFEIFESLPRSPLGKLLKHKLRAQVTAGTENSQREDVPQPGRPPHAATPSTSREP